MAHLSYDKIEDYSGIERRAAPRKKVIELKRVRRDHARRLAICLHDIALVPARVNVLMALTRVWLFGGDLSTAMKNPVVPRSFAPTK